MAVSVSSHAASPAPRATPRGAARRAASVVAAVAALTAGAEAADGPQRQPERLMLLAADGGGCRELCTVPGYPTIGSPAFSPAADLIALDGIATGGDFADTELLVVRADGTEPRVLGDGMMPSWSADGKRIAFSRSRGGAGVWVMDASGDPETARQIDGAGWGIQWSPDGSYWAYEKAGRLVIRSVETGKLVHQVRAADAPPITWKWNFTWGPDSRSLCGVVTLTNGQEAVAVQRLELPLAEVMPEAAAGGRDLVAGMPVGGVRLLVTGDDFDEDVAWHPNGRRITFTGFSAALGRQQIYECDPTQNGMPRMVPGQTPTTNIDQGWSPDGTTLVYVAHGDFDL